MEDDLKKNGKQPKKKYKKMEDNLKKIEDDFKKIKWKTDQSPKNQPNWL